MKIKSKSEKITPYDISISLLAFFFTTVLNISVLLLMNIPINKYNILISIITTIGVIYIFFKRDIKKVIKVFLITILIILIMIILCQEVFDISWDGRSYQKQAIGLLKDGWNPVYISAENFENNFYTNFNIEKILLLWDERYSKATWFFAAQIYSLTNNIEAGKAYTLIFMVIVFGMFYDYMRQKKIKRRLSIVISLLAALNPISFAQVFTYCVDGIVACTLMCLMLMFVAYFDDDCKREKKHIKIVISMLIIIGCNIKLSALLFIGIYCIAFFISVLLKNYKDKIKIKETLNMFIVLALSAGIALFVVGYSPYVTNIIRYDNPYEFLMNNEEGLLSKSNMENSAGLKNKSNAELFIISLFGEMGGYAGEYHTVKEIIKIPFTFDTKELLFYVHPDTRISGMGCLFSGVFILISGIYLYLIIKSKINIYKCKFYLKEANILLIISVLLVLILPGTFQQRYVGFIYFFPIYLLIFIAYQFTYNNKKNQIFIKTLMLATIITMSMNIAPWGFRRYEDFTRSAYMREQFRYLAMLDSSKYDIEIVLTEKYFSGIYYNFKDFGLNKDIYVNEKVKEDDSYMSMYIDSIRYKVTPISIEKNS